MMVEQTGQVCRSSPSSSSLPSSSSPLVRQMSRWMFMSLGDRREEQTGQAWRPGLMVGLEGTGEGWGEDVVVEEVEGAGEGRGEKVVVEEAGWGALACLGSCTVVM